MLTNDSTYPRAGNERRVRSPDGDLIPIYMIRDNTSPNRTAASQDLLTIAAVAVVVYAVSSVIHEGLGHGGACIAVGGTPQPVSSGVALIVAAVFVTVLGPGVHLQ